MKERFVEEIEDHGEWVLTRTIKEMWHKKVDLEEEVAEEELISERTGIRMEKLPDRDNCSVCGGYFTD
tara:strand:+ start:197 stop:400 length:204 start_codon:yes stop_codon:yes gene_type:complete